MALNVQGLHGHWSQLREAARKKWSQLTDADDHCWTEGDLNQIIGCIQERTGETRESIETFFSQAACGGTSAFGHAVESVGHAASHATNRIRQGCSHVAQSALDQYGHAREGVARSPMQWVATAFGVGFIAGMLAGYAGSHSYPRHRQRHRFF